MARIIISVSQRTARRDCRVRMRLDLGSRDTVAERNLINDIHRALSEAWKDHRAIEIERSDETGTYMPPAQG